MHRKTHIKWLVGISLILTTVIPTMATATTLFEGWFEVYVGAKKVGYLTERYEFVDNKFKAVSYLKTNTDGNSVTESLKAESKADLAPLKYSYTSKVGDQVKVVDATFKGETMNLEIFDGKTKDKSSKKIKKGVFLSQFLLYLILQQKDGLKVGKSYPYYAIAEEDGETYSGKAFIKDQEPVKGKDSFKILNEFKGEKFFTWVGTKGELLLTRAPDKNVEVRFADSQAQATEGMGVNLKDIGLLFGSIPGDADTLATKSDSDTSSKKISKKKSKASQPKASEATPGEGVEIKGVPPPKTDQEPAPNAGNSGVPTSGGAPQGP